MVMFLASPSKAFLPALSSAPAVIRHNMRLATSTSASASISTRCSLHHNNTSNNVARQLNKASRRSLTYLLGTTDSAKDAAMAAVQAAEEALNRAAEDAGAAGGAGEVQDTVAAARAAARNAMESLRRDPGGIGGMGGAGAQETVRSRQVNRVVRGCTGIIIALSAACSVRLSLHAAVAVLLDCCVSSLAVRDLIVAVVCRAVSAVYVLYMFLFCVADCISVGSCNSEYTRGLYFAVFTLAYSTSSGVFSTKASSTRPLIFKPLKNTCVIFVVNIENRHQTGRSNVTGPFRRASGSVGGRESPNSCPRRHLGIICGRPRCYRHGPSGAGPARFGSRGA